MPKNNKKQMKEISGESQGCEFVKCIREDTMRTFNNNRTYKMWRKIHDKRCDCLSKEYDVILTSTYDQVRDYGAKGNLDKSKTEFSVACQNII